MMMLALIAPIHMLLTLHILVTFVAVVLALTGYSLWQKILPTRYAERLTLAYRLIGLLALCLCLAPLFATSKLLPPHSQMWSAASLASVEPFAGPEPAGMVIPAVPASSTASQLVPWLAGLYALGVLGALLRLLNGARRLRRIKAEAFVVRQYRSVRILVTASVVVPFSFWWPGRCYVVLPWSMLAAPEQQRLAIAHELQHHRQRDTTWLYLIAVIKALCFANPLAYWLERQVSNLQEFACDEALVGRQRISTPAYCRCLLWVAQNAMQARRQPTGTVSMANATAHQILRRRIEVMMSLTPRPARSAHLSLLACLAALTMFGLTLVANAAVSDRVVTMTEAKAMAESAGGRHAAFPVVVNELVLAELNHFLGTPEGRETIKQSLAAMENYRPMIKATLAAEGLPEELMAVPIIESRYRNIASHRKLAYGAGIWMFIKSTAVQYGLRVDDEVDERLNVRLETDAAARLLLALHARFNDWGLALLAYNGGGSLVQRGITETGSRDVWTLMRQGHENDPGYVAKIMAAVLIMKNRATLE